MAFIPRLPTFHIPVQTYLKTAVAGEWIEGPEIMAQIYFPHRGQPGTTFATLYILYPKADNILRDASQLGQDPFYDTLAELDVVEFVYPTGTGEQHRYKVMQVAPRWLGFPNEHVAAYLKELLPAEWAAMTINPPPAFPAEWEMTLASVPNGTCPDCNELETSFLLDTLIADNQWESDLFDWACSGDQMKWVIHRSGVSLYLNLYQFNDPGLTSFATWMVADTTDWNGADPLDFELSAPWSDACDWPSTVTVNVGP